MATESEEARGEGFVYEKGKAPPRVTTWERVLEFNVKAFAACVFALMGWELWSWEGQYPHLYMLAALLFAGGAFISVDAGGVMLGEWRKQNAFNKVWAEAARSDTAQFLSTEKLEAAGCYEGGRLIGIDFNGRPLFSPTRIEQSHSIVIASAGSGKTSCGVLPSLISLAHEMKAGAKISTFVCDSKDGEIVAQMAPMLDELGIEYAILDDYDVMKGHPKRVSMNPFGELIRVKKEEPRSFADMVSSAMFTLHPSPPDDGGKNEYFYDSARGRGDVIIHDVANMEGVTLHPGAIWTILSDPDLYEERLIHIANNGDVAQQGVAKKILQYMEDKHEHEAAHVGAAMQAFSAFAAGSWLYDLVPENGPLPVLEHRDLMRRPMMLFIVGRADQATRAKAYFGLHLQAAMHAQTVMPRHIVHYIAEEAANTPLKEMTTKLQLLRGQGARIMIVATSEAGLQIAYGALATRVIMHEAVVKQYFSFTSYQEAKAVSDALGQRVVIKPSLSQSSDKSSYGTSWSLSREPMFPTDRLMSMPSDYQIIHIGRLGFILCLKCHSSHIGPYAAQLGRNRVEDKDAVVNIKFNL